jgi:sugar/nucleoside kinase (ribokinase family)
MLDMITIGDIKLDTFVVLNDASLQCQLKMPECLLCLEYGAKIVVDVVDSQLAGSAPNVAVGLSRMGLKTAVLSIMGEDGTRELALRKLKEENVSTRYIRHVHDEQSAYSVVLNFKGEKTLLTSHIHHAYRLPKKMATAKWLYVSEMGPGYEQLYRSVTSMARHHRRLIGLNPGTIQIQEKKNALYKLIKVSYVLFVNVEEAQAISGEKTVEIHRLAPALWKLGVKKVVITDGKNGAHSFDGKELLYGPIFPGKLVEATGAGDAFATGFVGALIHGQLHDEALRWGSVNSASVIGKIGPQAGLLSATQIRARLRKRPTFRSRAL